MAVPFPTYNSPLHREFRPPTGPSDPRVGMLFTSESPSVPLRITFWPSPLLNLTPPPRVRGSGGVRRLFEQGHMASLSLTESKATPSVEQEHYTQTLRSYLEGS